MAYRQTRTGRLFIGPVDVTDWTRRQRLWWLLTGRAAKSRLCAVRAAAAAFANKHQNEEAS